MLEFLQQIGQMDSEGLLDSISPPKLALLPLVEKGQSQQVDSLSDMDLGWHHPSFIANHKCERALYLNRKYTINESHPTQLLRIFDNGHDVHSRLQRYLRHFLYGTWRCKKCYGVINEHEQYLKILQRRGENVEHILTSSMTPIALPQTCPRCAYGVFAYKEWRVISEKVEIGGRIDGIIRTSEGIWHGIEIKSANDRSFASLSVNSKLYEKYVRQFSIYLSVLGIRTGTILVENKNTQQLREFYVEVADTEVARVLEKLQKINRMLQKDEAPDEVKSEECYDCKFHGVRCFV